MTGRFQPRPIRPTNITLINGWKLKRYEITLNGEVTVPIHRTYAFDDIVEAHRDMEAGRAIGKLVVTT